MPLRVVSEVAFRRRDLSSHFVIMFIQLVSCVPSIKASSIMMNGWAASSSHALNSLFSLTLCSRLLLFLMLVGSTTEAHDTGALFSSWLRHGLTARDVR